MKRCATNPRIAPCGSRDPLFLDYMRYFVLFEDDGDALIKKIAGYHQFHGVREAVRVTTIASADSDDGQIREKLGDYQIGSQKAGYHNRSIKTAQVIEEMIEMAKDFQDRLKRDEELGLNPDELAFYDALANNESAVRELGDKILKTIAVELTEKLRNSTTVDWQHRESVRAKLRNLIRRLLRRYKYPPDEAPQAITLVMQQAEALASSWASGDDSTISSER